MRPAAERATAVLSHENITGVILAGGRGRRLGGADKGLVGLRGLPMIAHVIAALKPQVADIVVSANRNRDRYGEFGYRVVADDNEDYLGPLAGMASALAFVSTPYAAIVACDVPLLPRDYVARLAATLAHDANAHVALAHDGARAHYTSILLHRDMRRSLLEYLDEGQRKVGDWLSRHTVAIAGFHDCSEAFANVNDAETLDALTSTRA